MDGVAAALEGVRQGIAIQEIRACCTRFSTAYGADLNPEAFT